jgi:hypothetical protein
MVDDFRSDRKLPGAIAKAVVQRRVDMPLKEDPRRGRKIFQHDRRLSHALVPFGQHHGKWLAAKRCACQVRVRERVRDHCEIELSGANATREFAGKSRLEIDPQPRVKRKFHGADEGNQASIRIRGLTDHNSVINSLQGFAGGENRALRMRESQSRLLNLESARIGQQDTLALTVAAFKEAGTDVQFDFSQNAGYAGLAESDLPRGAVEVQFFSESNDGAKMIQIERSAAAH